MEEGRAERKAGQRETEEWKSRKRRKRQADRSQFHGSDGRMCGLEAEVGTYDFWLPEGRNDTGHRDCQEATETTL